MGYIKSSQSLAKRHSNLKLSRLSLAVILATFAASSYADELNLLVDLQKALDSKGIEYTERDGAITIDKISSNKSILGDFGGPLLETAVSGDGNLQIDGGGVKLIINEVTNDASNKRPVPALNFMQNGWLQSTNDNNRLSTFNFNAPLTVQVKSLNFSISSLAADGSDNPGLFLSNKKKNLNFYKPVVGEIYYTNIEAEGSNQSPSNKTSADHPAILAGIYTAFGSANLGSFTEEEQQKETFGQAFNQFDIKIWKEGDSKSIKMGRTSFNAGLDLRIINDIQTASSDTSDNKEWTAAYGIYVNEGGGVYIKERANLIAITSDKADYVSAIHLSANAGVLDPFKQGEFKLSNSLVSKII